MIQTKYIILEQIKMTCMEFNKTDKMAFLIRSNYHLLPVFHRFGFTLGFRNKSVEQLCIEKGLNADFFITIANTFHNKNYFPEEKLLAFSPILIIDYLRKTHQYYISYSLPKIEVLIHTLILSGNTNKNEMQMIEEFYLRYKTKLLKHIDDEEKMVFPYIDKLINKPGSITNKTFRLNFEEEHENVDLEIDDLKNLIVKYINSDYDELVCNELIAEIFRFEKDIFDHARIEDMILIPQVKQLQNKL
jgi:regulator of cell morphogenesis and NO signaling